VKKSALLFIVLLQVPGRLCGGRCGFAKRCQRKDRGLVDRRPTAHDTAKKDELSIGVTADHRLMLKES